ncbi:uncharacterized protein SCHCODRAFT_02504386 [Schizophyllum commune H4-8]|uniref:SURP motif domain-containing protein n=1 Tax=Schizophyllum commune (strain H4-8 / FGSC 9210) TaxID=578458 RepID=D8Q7C9_SCHCM|nr:uncharacterized protein SCHCODRAFT_02504386 [Schizophyllum commune H4-8]KAI5891549.1 hypothetical protein SCHCODRAFT_02504386 [Schizophyllum commune H4-8]
MSYRKRKRENRHQTPPPALDLNLLIQAHEADIICGPQAERAAAYLEVNRRDENTSLIRWAASGSQAARPMDSALRIHDDEDSMPDPESGEEDVWVDRYDARLLLDSVPSFGTTQPAAPPPSGGWSDLPEDAEDLFYFAPDEIDDYRREKRRRKMEREHEERVKARRAEDGEEEDDDPWGGSDEEPDEPQAELMRKTAKHILSSPNPAQLEMRILANFGGEKKFAFLRGRWSRAWAATNVRARQEKAEAEKPNTPALGGLGDYGDSDDESGDEPAPAEQPPPAQPTEVEASSEAVKAARRAKLTEWAEKRRREKEGHP